jgi:integrase/recombinase XerD
MMLILLNTFFIIILSFNIKKICSRRDSDPSLRLERRKNTPRERIKSEDLDKFIKLREIEGLSKRWLYDVRAALNNYLNAIKWKMNEDKSLEYFKQLKEHYSTTSYRRRLYQIRKFLTFFGIDWAKNIKPPREPCYVPKHVATDDIRKTLDYFKDHHLCKQLQAVTLLGATSGMRAEEIYQLNPKDIDLENRIVHINHYPDNGQTTKSGISRISFFTEEARSALSDYFEFYKSHSPLVRIFGQSHIERQFRKAPIKVMHLRKFFSQEWDRRGGPTSIKKILMGYSLKGDVDLMHYNYQSEEDLKKIYDKVSINIL